MAEKKMNKDEQIGYHQGALETLLKERQELVRIVQIVEQLIQMHVAGLKELGIDLAKLQAEAQKPQRSGSDGKIDDLLKK